jgi:hypothetical protein
LAVPICGSRNLKFRDFGLGCLIFSGGAFTDVELEHVALDNVRRGIWLKDTATFDTFKMTELVGRGNSRGFIVVEAAGAHLEIGKFDLDGDGQTGDNFAKGIHLDAAIDDVWVHGWDGAPSRTGNFRIGVNDPDYSDYWNCDGFIAEGSVTKLRVDNVEAWGNTDGGLDIKAPDAVLTNCIARENKRNYRLWHSGQQLVECEGPVARRRSGPARTAPTAASASSAAFTTMRTRRTR